MSEQDLPKAGLPRQRRKTHPVAYVLLAACILYIVSLFDASGCSNTIEVAPFGAAISQIASMELSFTKMLADAGAPSLGQMFANPEDLVRPTLLGTIAHETRIAYDLLKRGSSVDAGLKPEVRAKLAPSYMNIGMDPWKKPYYVYFGPWKPRPEWGYKAIPFRIYKPDLRDPPVPTPDEYTVDAGDDIGRAGYPVEPRMPVYIFSCGKDGQINQVFGPGYDALEPKYKGGGDDINNWDKSQSWREFYD